jgi:hypothetical protein
MTPSPYAWVLMQVGPAKYTLVMPDGSSRVLVNLATGLPDQIIIFGQRKTDPDLGEIWFQGGDFACLKDPETKAACRV